MIIFSFGFTEWKNLVYEEFMEDFNNFTPNFKFTNEFGKKNISFLDLNITLPNGELLTDLHIKFTDHHQYLHYSSPHPQPQAATGGVLYEKVLLEISQNSQENTCARVSMLCRSSRPEVFCKKCILRNFAKFTGKYLCQSLFFNKVAGLMPATLLKKRLWRLDNTCK